MTDAPVPAGYDNLLDDVVAAVQHARTQLIAKSNASLIELYWHIGRAILDRQIERGYGNAIIDRLANDLRARYPSQRGFSPRNLWYMRAFAAAWTHEQILQARLQNLGWTHHQVLLDRLDRPADRQWYADRALTDGWSYRLLGDRIKAQLHLREGNAPSNFDATLPDVGYDHRVLGRLATDPYRLDFVALDRDASERQLETALTERITEFLTHLGRGFAYLGRQHRITVGDTDFHLDLLFYNTQLHAYVVFELKTTDFTPAHAGQLAFYVTAIERQLRTDGDGPTIGVLLVAGKDRLVVDYALATTTAPLTVATYTYAQLPEQVRNHLPSEDALGAALD